MREIKKCPICGGGYSELAFSVIAPFISIRTGIPMTTSISLVECNVCKLVFFNKRYLASEAQEIYRDYRSESYYIDRNRVEPWYTMKTNFAIGSDPKEIVERKDRIKSFFCNAGIKLPLKNVLDYGGDMGQFIPDDLAINKYLFEISDLKTVDGVKKVKKPKENTYQSILLCHILEHVDDIDKEVKAVTKYLSKGGYIYIEVPSEQFYLNRMVMRTSLYGIYLKLLLKIPFAFMFVDHHFNREVQLIKK